MTAKDLAIVVRGVAPAMRDYVARELGPWLTRLKALEDRPLPLDGQTGAQGPTGEKGADGAVGPQGERGPEGPPGAQGAPGSNGERGPMGEKGMDGLIGERGPEGPAGPARDGRDGLPGVPGMPGEKGMDGTNGKDGADGLGFDDLAVLHDGERGFTFQFTRGDRVKSYLFTMPIDIYRGVYVDGRTYERGDGVTWGGSEWHCNDATTAKPGDGSKSWTLKVKRGRDGKDGRDADPGLPTVTVGKPR